MSALLSITIHTVVISFTDCIYMLFIICLVYAVIRYIGVFNSAFSESYSNLELFNGQ